MKRSPVLALSLLVVTAAGVVACSQKEQGTNSASDGSHASSHAKHPTESASRRPFSLTDPHGRPVTDETFRGEWLIVFFGFTHCPDFCPTTLFQIATALKQLEDHAKDIRVVFITVDPERDSPALLETYLKPFGPRFTALTGNAQQIEAATRTFRTYSRKQSAAPDGSYSVDHSTSIYVLDPNGLLSRQLSSEATAEQLAASLRTIMGRDSQIVSAVRAIR